MTDDHSPGLLRTVALVGGGGFAGANLRYLVGLLLPGMRGTLVVNVLGSLALGALAYAGLRFGAPSGEARLAAGAGFLSSFTTYSTFALEAVLSPEWALAYVLASYALGFAGALTGRAVVLRLGRRESP